MIERRLLLSDGTEVHVVAEGPESGKCLPAVVVMPPGLQPGTQDIETNWSQSLSSSGYWVFHWDPRGRGESTGIESANGIEGASDTASVLRWVSTLDRIDPDRILILSRSFGGALAAGALGQHADLSPYLWVDYESPGWLFDDIQQVEGRSRDQLESLATDSEWWTERSPAYWVANVTRPYLRIQGIPDHAQGARYAHAQEMLYRIKSEQIWLNEQPWTGKKLVRDDLVAGGIRPEDDIFMDWVHAAERQVQ